MEIFNYGAPSRPDGTQSVFVLASLQPRSAASAGQARVQVRGRMMLAHAASFWHSITVGVEAAVSLVCPASHVAICSSGERNLQNAQHEAAGGAPAASSRAFRLHRACSRGVCRLQGLAYDAVGCCCAGLLAWVASGGLGWDGGGVRGGGRGRRGRAGGSAALLVRHERDHHRVVRRAGGAPGPRARARGGRGGCRGREGGGEGGG